jgi:DHA3 family tetracycline resistance protein-like MFS transporter
MNVLRSLKHRPFALLWTGQTISRLGDSLYRIALSWWVLEKTGSAVAMGTVLIFSQIPLLLFLLIGGCSTSVFALIWTHTLQEMVPGGMLGRVYSINALGSFVLLPIGFARAGWATELLGAPIVFLIGGIGVIVLVLLGLSHPAIRNLD